MAHEQSLERVDPRKSEWSYRPRLDVTECGDEFTVTIDMPGTTADAIRVDFADRILTIHGAVSARQQTGVDYLTHEYGVGDFDREFALTDGIAADRITADYENGVLTVHLPKSEEVKPRRIPIRGS